MMSDLISREDAIDALGEKPVGETDWDLGCRNQWEWDTEILRTLPTAEPERKKGKWIMIPAFENMRCSNCKIVFGDEMYPRNYCPNCGADMRGEK